MNNMINKHWFLIFIIITFLAMSGCGNSEEKKKSSNLAPAASTSQVPSVAPVASAPPAVDAEKQATASDIAVSVDGNVLKKAELEKKLKEKLNAFKGKIPADKIKEARANIKKQLMEEFIMRTLLANEVEKRKIAATNKEIKATMDQIQATLPPDKKLETFMKENKISKEYIALGIKVNKMVKQEAGNKTKPSQKEISKFYNENKDKFIAPENAHVRHILIAFTEKDDDKVKAEKKIKIENLRKEVVAGADFAEIARKNSDCPSKDNGGDLGIVRKGQTVKPFEDAVFSQEIKAIGPVVSTEYGYHVIQVLERNPQKTVALEEVKSKIAAYIEQQKQAEVFNALLKKLRDNAKILVYES
ncbi:MAG: peptidylprolyl isomerase [Smithellaceae bacterium]